METKKTILLADDHPDIRLICKAMLEEEYDVKIVSNGLEVMVYVENEKPDLIILDIAMPEMDGLTALTKLKENTHTCLIPVILLTAKTKYEDVMEGYQQQADYYISKPFTKERLLNGVRLILGDQRPVVQPKQES